MLSANALTESPHQLLQAQLHAAHGSWLHRSVYHIGSFPEFGSLIGICGDGMEPKLSLVQRRSLMKKVTVVALAFVLVLSVAPVMAVTHTGVITLVHYNPAVQGRGVCVRTNPTGPGTGWFCLYPSSFLYESIDRLLQQAYIFGRSCSLVWDTTDQSGHNLLTIVQCQWLRNLPLVMSLPLTASAVRGGATRFLPVSPGSCSLPAALARRLRLAMPVAHGVAAPRCLHWPLSSLLWSDQPPSTSQHRL